MIRPASLEIRLSLALGIALTALWLVATAWAIFDLREQMKDVFDSALQETAQRLLPLAVTEIVNRDPADSPQRLAPISKHKEFFTYLVRDAQGRILMQSHNADPANFPDWDGPGFRASATHRFYSEATLQGTIRLTVAEPLAQRRETVRDIALRFALPLLMVLPLTVIVIVVVVRLGLARLRSFRAELAERDARNLSPVPTENLPDDLRPMANTVNNLLTRLSAAFEAERGFASNAAHELRTPLAGAIAQTQRLRQEIADPGVADRADAIEATLKRLTRTAERLMQLARAEGGRLRCDAPADLRPILRVVTDDMAHSVGRDRLTLDLPGEAVYSDIDPDTLAIVVRNLIDNALRHGAADALVRIALNADGELSVANDGPTVPSDQLRKLSDRFQRAHTDQGSGLGLAIVSAIAQRVGGTLQLYSPRRDSDTGFEAVIHIPLST